MFLTSHVLCRLSSPLLLLPPTPSPPPHLVSMKKPPRHSFIFIIKSSSIFPSRISVLAHQIVHHTPKVIIHCLLFCSNIIFLSLWTHIENDIPNIIIVIIICTYKMILVHIYLLFLWLASCSSIFLRVRILCHYLFFLEIWTEKLNHSHLFSLPFIFCTNFECK